MKNQLIRASLLSILATCLGTSKNLTSWDNTPQSHFSFYPAMIKESLFAAEEREAKLNKLDDTLQLLEQHVDFAALAAAIDQAAPRPSLDRGGRRPFPTELMVRAMIIQQFYHLSDEQIEYQLLVV